MAQTKRKRRTKHRGNAAGQVETRGRTGRPPSPDRAQGGGQAGAHGPLRAPAVVAQRGQPRPDRHGALRRRGHPLLRADRSCSAVALGGVHAADLHPARLLHRLVLLQAAARPSCRAARALSGMDLAMLTVGPLQENAFLLRRDGRRPGAARRPRRRGRAPAPGASRRPGRRSRRSCSPTPTSTTSARSRPSPRRPAPRSTARSSRSPVLADINSYVSWPGVRPVRELRRRRDGRGRRAPEPRRARHRRDLHARPQPRPRHLRDRGRGRPALRRRALPGLGRAHRPAGRRPRRR